jgi:hypothetical protein
VSFALGASALTVPAMSENWDGPPSRCALRRDNLRLHL